MWCILRGAGSWFCPGLSSYAELRDYVRGLRPAQVGSAAVVTEPDDEAGHVDNGGSKSGLTLYVKAWSSL